MKKLALASAVALAASSSAAFALPGVSFAGGSGTLPTGTVIIEDFESFAPGDSIGVNAFAFDTNNGLGAIPAYGSTGNYAAVATGGIYSLTFAPTSVLAFVLGSLDTYNTLTLFFADATSQSYFGGQIINDLSFPSGDQISGQTNGVVTYSTGAGPKIVGAAYQSSGVSFEFDNISVASAVPEPATWAMMLVGIGAIGGMLRARRKTNVAFAF